MKYGVREICDVVFRAKAPMKLGKKQFFKDEPVIYFDTLTTSSLEGAVTTVYAQGGRGNTRLMAWDGERTVTFNMEDALISPEGLAILTGAGLIDAGDTDADNKPITIKVHATERPKINAVVSSDTITEYTITLGNKAYQLRDKTDMIYVFPLDSNGNINTEPYIPTSTTTGADGKSTILHFNASSQIYTNISSTFKDGNYALVDYYVEYDGSASDKTAMQINITPDQFGSNFYIEASTLFKDEQGTDHPAEFIIPNGKVQSNFTFNLAASGDPSTFAFTVDAFPDYTRFDKSQKVLSAIQVIGASAKEDKEYVRESTVSAGGVLKDDDKNIDTNPEG